MRNPVRAFALLALPVLALLVTTALMQEAPTPAPEPNVGLSRLSEEDQALFRSAVPKTVLIDASTGEVLRVKIGMTYP